MVSVSYSITRSVLLEDGRSVTVPFYDLLSSESDPGKRASLLEDLRRVVNTFRNTPLSDPVEIASEYSMF